MRAGCTARCSAVARSTSISLIVHGAGLPKDTRSSDDHGKCRREAHPSEVVSPSYTRSSLATYSQARLGEDILCGVNTTTTVGRITIGKTNQSEGWQDLQKRTRQMEI